MLCHFKCAKYPASCTGFFLCAFSLNCYPISPALKCDVDFLQRLRIFETPQLLNVIIINLAVFELLHADGRTGTTNLSTHFCSFSLRTLESELCLVR
jgi:hypothetical protein